MGRIFAVTSGKGGVGKSTIAVGLGHAFAKMGQKVLLIDMDEGLRCLDILLGIDQKIVFDLLDILLGNDISDAIYYDDTNPLLHLIPAPMETGKIKGEILEEFIKKIQKFYDIIIFDFPAGVNFSLYKYLPSSALFMAVTYPDPVALRDASAISEKLKDIGVKSKLVINNFDYKYTKQKLHINIDDVIDKANLQLLGIVPKSKELELLSAKHKIKDSKVMAAFTRIAKRLLGENILLPNLKNI